MRNTNQSPSNFRTMNTSEKFSLKWNDFSTNLTSTFSELRTDQSLLDVTLACEDGTQFAAHRVVLTAGSQFFKNILMTKKKDNPIINIRGLKSSDLASVVNFSYHGEVEILQEDLNDFLSIAEQLQLKGLVGAANKNEEEANMKPLANHLIKQFNSFKTKIAPITQTYSEMFPKEEYNDAFNRSSLISDNLPTTQIANIVTDEDLKQKMDDLIEQNGEDWSYRVCGKIADKSISRWKRNLQRHTQIHMEGLLYTCNLCGNEFRCKIYLDTHRSKYHKIV